MEKEISGLINNWQKRNIASFYCQDKLEANQKALELIPLTATIGISGSQTIEQLGLVKELEARGNRIFNQYKPGCSREESLELRRQGAGADYYLASANALAKTGELVFLSAFGNRTCGVSNAKNVVIICGINKIALSLDEAIKRAREYATPLNCKRLNYNSACIKDGICHKDICLFPEYKRMCCQLLVIEAEITQGRLKVILVNESLGF